MNPMRATLKGLRLLKRRMRLPGAGRMGDVLASLVRVQQ